MNDSTIDLKEAYELFSSNPTQESYEYVLYTLFMSARNSLGTHVPVEMDSKGNICYGVVQTTDGYYYSICTSPEQLALCPESSSIITTLDLMVVKSANDQDINGICINPYSTMPCFIPRDYIKRILKKG